MTPVIVLAVLSIIWSLVILVTSPPSAGLIVVLAFGITMGIFFLYVLDRILVRKIAFKTLVSGELFLGILLAFYIYYEQSTIDINIKTNEDYIVILFDSKENLLKDFPRKGVFGKELNLNEHIVHVDSSLYGKENLRINEREEWTGFSQTEGKIKIQGQPVRYILRAKRNRQPSIEDLLPEIDKP